MVIPTRVKVKGPRRDRIGCGRKRTATVVASCGPAPPSTSATNPLVPRRSDPRNFVELALTLPALPGPGSSWLTRRIWDCMSVGENRALHELRKRNGVFSKHDLTGQMIERRRVRPLPCDRKTRPNADRPRLSYVFTTS